MRDHVEQPIAEPAPDSESNVDYCGKHATQAKCLDGEFAFCNLSKNVYRVTIMPMTYVDSESYQTTLQDELSAEISKIESKESSNGEKSGWNAGAEASGGGGIPGWVHVKGKIHSGYNSETHNEYKKGAVDGYKAAVKKVWAATSAVKMKHTISPFAVLIRPKANKPHCIAAARVWKTWKALPHTQADQLQFTFMEQTPIGELRMEAAIEVSDNRRWVLKPQNASCPEQTRHWFSDQGRGPSPRQPSCVPPGRGPP